MEEVSQDGGITISIQMRPVPEGEPEADVEVSGTKDLDVISDVLCMTGLQICGQNHDVADVLETRVDTLILIEARFLPDNEMGISTKVRGSTNPLWLAAGFFTVQRKVNGMRKQAHAEARKVQESGGSLWSPDKRLVVPGG